MALQYSANKNVSLDESLVLARHIGVEYFLVKSTPQVVQLKNSPRVRPLWEIEGWTLFANRDPAALPIAAVASVPVVAWLPAVFRNRSVNDLDLFNVSEQIAFDGHPEVCVLWAFSSGTSIRTVTQLEPRVIIVIDPAAGNATNNETLMTLLESDASRLNVLLLDDGSSLARVVDGQHQRFADYKKIPTSAQTTGSLLAEVARTVTNWEQEPILATANANKNLWQTSIAYFPAWRTIEPEGLWLTGQGGMALVSSSPPVLNWTGSKSRLLGVASGIAGILLAILVSRPRSARRLRKGEAVTLGAKPGALSLSILSCTLERWGHTTSISVCERKAYAKEKSDNPCFVWDCRRNRCRSSKFVFEFVKDLCEAQRTGEERASGV